MTRTRVFVLLQALAIGFAGVVEAQSVQGLQVGDRIRVQIAPSNNWRIGRYDGRANDTLWISQCDDCLGGLVPIARVNELDLSEGIPRSRSKQVVYSGLIGLTAGAIGAVTVFNNSKHSCQEFCNPGDIIGVGFGVIGTVLGAAIGAIVPLPHEQWRRIL